MSAMNCLRFSVLVGFITLLKCLSNCFATTLTTLVLHEETETWSNARQVCSQGGGKLMSIQDPEKLADLLYMDSLPSWNNRVMSADLWVGLHTDVGASCDAVQYQWDDGEPLGSWSDWYVGSYTEPNMCTSDLCIRISTSKWKTLDCNSQYGFVCEYLGGTCGFETVTDKTFTRGPDSSDIPDVQNIFTKMESTNLATCLEACQTSSIGDLDCWFVVTNSSNTNVCYLYFTDDKYLADRAENTTVILGLNIHIKRCGNVAVNGETSTSTSVATTTTCLALTTVAASTPSTQTMTMTTAQTTQPTTTQQTTFVSTSTIASQTTAGAECLNYNNQTITYTPTELQEKLQQLKADLMVIKTSTNRHARTLISVYDGRQSAVNIGLVSNIFIGVILVLFFIADIPVFYRHIRGRWDDEDDYEDDGDEIY